MDNGTAYLSRPPSGRGGYTIIELMVTIAIAAIFMVLAAPMFVEVRERAVVRGAASDLVEAVAQAKLEAAKRNDFVTVSVRGSDNAWCIGVQSGLTGCDCTAATACTVAQVKTNELKGARLLSAADFGGTPASDFTIDPRLSMLKGLTGGGVLVVRSPSALDYRLQFSVTTTGQTQICQPSGGAHKLADYPSC